MKRGDLTHGASQHQLTLAPPPTPHVLKSCSHNRQHAGLRHFLSNLHALLLHKEEAAFVPSPLTAGREAEGRGGLAGGRGGAWEMQ